MAVTACYRSYKPKRLFTINGFRRPNLPISWPSLKWLLAQSASMQPPIVDTQPRTMLASARGWLCLAAPPLHLHWCCHRLFWWYSLARCLWNKWTCPLFRTFLQVCDQLLWVCLLLQPFSWWPKKISLRLLPTLGNLALAYFSSSLRLLAQGIWKLIPYVWLAMLPWRAFYCCINAKHSSSKV